MGFIMLLFGIYGILTLSGIIWQYSRERYYNEQTNKWNYIPQIIRNFIITVSVILFLVSCISIVSYLNYLDDRAAFDSVITQYKQAITLYKDKVTLDVNKAVTDLKYQGNAGSITKLITQLRQQVIKYDKSIIIKRKLKGNFWFSALTVAPDDDMKLINLLMSPPQGVEVE